MGSKVTGKTVQITYKDENGDSTLEADKLIVAVGRRAYTQGVLSPEANVELDERGLIHVNEHCATNQPGIYAIGDVVRGPMLAHKAS